MTTLTLLANGQKVDEKSISFIGEESISGNLPGFQKMKVKSNLKLSLVRLVVKLIKIITKRKLKRG